MPEQNLIPPSLARRETLLAELTDHMRHLHRRRTRRRRAAAACAIALFAGTLALIPSALTTRDAEFTALSPAPPRTAPEQQLTHGADTSIAQPRALTAAIHTVHTDPGVLDRWRARVATPTHVFLDDQTLLAVMSQLDQPAGLIRMGDHAWIAPHPR